LNKDGSSKQLKSIKITINGKNYKLSVPALDLKTLAGCGTGNGFNYNANSQLDVNDAIEILERCLKDLQKEKASQNK